MLRAGIVTSKGCFCAGDCPARFPLDQLLLDGGRLVQAIPFSDGVLVFVDVIQQNK